MASCCNGKEVECRATEPVDICEASCVGLRCKFTTKSGVVGESEAKCKDSQTALCKCICAPEESETSVVIVLPDNKEVPAKIVQLV